MPELWWWAGAAVVVSLLAAYLVWTDRRVERLHARASSAAAALDAHLLRRAAAAAVLAEQLDAVELYAAARIALDAGSRLDPGTALGTGPRLGTVADSGEREAAENDLTRQLRRLAPTTGLAAAEPVIAASRRVALARQVHTDSVRDALINRDRPLVRLFGMARGHPRPRYFDIDEPTLTPSLTEPPRQITPHQVAPRSDVKT
ncbi:hypothetical protein [Catenuloplanes atrovinosus]|nr:hypothetical protein [Catenuloplanes atrovinosus]